jgi:hypothetical protein
MDQLQTYYDYMKQGFLDKMESGAVLRRTSAQLMGFLVVIRADFFVGRKNKLSIEVADMIQRILQSKLAKEKGIMRRSEVFKCFASIVTTLSKEDDEKKRCFNTITPYLEVLLEANYVLCAISFGFSKRGDEFIRRKVWYRGIPWGNEAHTVCDAIAKSRKKDSAEKIIHLIEALI